MVRLVIFETPSRSLWRHRETKVCSVVCTCPHGSHVQCRPIWIKGKHYCSFIYATDNGQSIRNDADRICRRRNSSNQWLEFWIEFFWNPYTKALRGDNSSLQTVSTMTYGSIRPPWWQIHQRDAHSAFFLSGNIPKGSKVILEIIS